MFWKKNLRNEIFCNIEVSFRFENCSLQPSIPNHFQFVCAHGETPIYHVKSSLAFTRLSIGVSEKNYSKFLIFEFFSKYVSPPAKFSPYSRQNFLPKLFKIKGLPLLIFGWLSKFFPAPLSFVLSFVLKQAFKESFVFICFPWKAFAASPAVHSAAYIFSNVRAAI